ncbi:Na(+)/H(+) antiporter subunit F1 [Paenibacillus sp. CAU 1782]
MMETILWIALGLLAIAILGCLYRLLLGPSIVDRIASLDTIGILLLSMVAVIGMVNKTEAYFDLILVIGILTFIGTTAMARYIERGIVLESGTDE